MRRFSILFIAITALLFACNQADVKTTGGQDTNQTAGNPENALEDSANYTSIQWLDSTFRDLGKVTEGQIVEISWRFKNIGDKPLIIVNTNASCGCTVAEKPEQPIAPGEESVIKAKFDSNGRPEGEQRKEVYVTANTKESPTHNLSFRLELVKK
jgi:hypothetical protein